MLTDVMYTECDCTIRQANACILIKTLSWNNRFRNICCHVHKTPQKIVLFHSSIFFNVCIHKEGSGFFFRSQYVTDVTEINNVTLIIITTTDSGEMPKI
jgi:hypothetical protein